MTLALFLATTGLAGPTLHCALDLDFESLSNQCDFPRFDVLTYDQFCSGELTFMPRSEAGDANFEGVTSQKVLAPVVDVENQLLAFATVARKVVANDPCDQLAIGIQLAVLDTHLGLELMGGLRGSDEHLIFDVRKVDAVQTCASQTTQYVWPSDVEIIETSPFVAVLATYLDGGLVYTEFAPTTAIGAEGSTYEPSHLIHVGDPDTGNNQWSCSLGTCGLQNGSRCNDQSECQRAHFCKSQECMPLPETECTNDSSCPKELRCDTAMDPHRCRIPCTQHGDCPPPGFCNATPGFCGGHQACSLSDDSCPGDDVCVDGQCYAACNPLETVWTEQPATGFRCISIEEETGLNTTGIWGNPGSLSRCDDDRDCGLETPMAAAIIESRPFFHNRVGLVILQASGPARLAVLDDHGHLRLSPALLEPSDFIQNPGDTDFTDALFDETRGELVLATANLGLVTIDLARLESDELTITNFTGQSLPSDSFHVHPANAEPRAWVQSLHLVGSTLAVVETASPDEILPPVPGIRQARVRLLQRKGEDYETFATYDLGDSTAPHVGSIAGDPALVLIAADLSDGTRLILHDLDRPEEPLLVRDITEIGLQLDRSYPRIAGDALFLSNVQGIFPTLIDIGGERE